MEIRRNGSLGHCKGIHLNIFPPEWIFLGIDFKYHAMKQMNLKHDMIH